MSSVIISGNTSGTITLDAPAVAGTTTLTLPATSGTIALTASPTFTGQATIPTINLTGGQITFPATAVPSADANTLDDYEEGTYTITATPTTSGTITGDSTRNAGVYTKIGRIVTVYGLFGVDSVSSPVGTRVNISLPFPIAATAEYSQYWTTFSSAYTDGSGSTAIGSDSPGGGASYFQFIKAANTVAVGGQLKFIFIYFTD